MNTEIRQNPYAPPEAKVGDIQAADDAFEPASRGIRLGAAMLDTVIILVLMLPILIAAEFNPLALMDPSAFTSISGLVTVIGTTGLLIVTIVLVHRNGQTVGKKLLAIKVVRSDGSRASLRRIFLLRNLVNAIPSAIPLVGNFYGLLDHVFIFGDKRQCLHDKIADTIVVNA
jgi:uncharacterized RDD family membrane protein YckC